MTAADATPAIITLTTDFGLSDPYVAAMKGVILTINPRATIVDVSHAVRPQQIVQAAFITQSAWPYFPDGTIHIAVVDPGVGTTRRAIVIKTPRGRFVGPDNGVLSAALPDEARPIEEAAAGALPQGCRAFVIENPRYLREPVSATFHGRDVFAHVAAHLSLGAPIEELGERIDSVLALPLPRARRDGDGTLRGRVVHIDRFGNVITDIRARDLPRERFELEIRGRRIEDFVRTYAEATSLSALAGSSGYLEIALPNGNASGELGVDIGQDVSLRVV